MIEFQMRVLHLDAKQNPPLARTSKTPGTSLRQCRFAFGIWIVLVASIAVAAPPSPKSKIADSDNGPQDRKGATEWGWNIGGATGIPGGSNKRSFWTLNLHWGRVLTAAWGHGPLRGTLEYTVEIVPVFMTRESNNVFGGGITPVLLQYNFDYSRRFVPFIQAGAGTLLTTQRVPEDTSRFNFTPQGGVGIYWFRWPRSALELGVRYHHMSNGGLTGRNPGHNGLYFYTGVSWWR